MSSSSNSSNFHSYPERFPKTRRKSVEMLQQIHAISKKGPRTLIGTVVDISFFHTMGYVTATTELGVVSVYGVPYGSLVPQMRILVRQMGAMASNRSFVFDGMAPNISGLGMASGSVVYMTSTSNPGSAPLVYSPSGGVFTPAHVGPTGYYWHFFFYLPQLPAAQIFLFQMVGTNGSTNTFTCLYQPDGFLKVLSEAGTGYVSNTPVAPHHIHWIQIQPGISGKELLIDGLANYSVWSGSIPSFTGNGTPYSLSLLSAYTGTNLAPIGSWFSKFGFGYAQTSSISASLTGSVPTSDSQLLANSPTSNNTSLSSLLCSDSVGNATLTNSSPSPSSQMALDTFSVAAVVTGPY